MAEATTSVGVLDASVAVKLVVPEVGTAESLAALERPVGWVAPRMLVTEVAATLRRKVSANELSPIHAVDALSATLDAIADGVIRLAEDEALVRGALTLALALGHEVPDCLYLALAEREGAVLASADRKLLTLARGRGIDVIAVPSA